MSLARLLALVFLPLVGAFADEAPVPPPEQAAQYRADVAKTILELQPFRRSQSMQVTGPGGAPAKATLIELNPHINAWYLLTLDWERDGGANYHLENPDPAGRRLRLEQDGLVIVEGGTSSSCALWSGAPSALESARASGLPSAPLCEERLYLRNRVEGRRTDLERVTDFLRDHVWGGEAIVGFVRRHLFQDAYLENGSPGTATGSGIERIGAPAPASLSQDYAGRSVIPDQLGIRVEAPTREMAFGRWYQAAGIPGVYVSVIQPQAVAQDILQSHPERVSPLDAVEAGALDYLIAFDLEAFELRFALGTDHPRVGWSPRPPEAVRDERLPGPDGIGSVAPLVTTGLVSPALVERTVATFTGGFKREHGAFKYGDLAGRNRGSHYGFIEEGIVFSKLQPDLATLLVLDDGSVELRTWAEADERGLGRVRFARQNGVPLIEPDPTAGAPVPGALVATWGPGNWSGSAAGELRALRAAACLQETGGWRFLIYGYFSTATPSAMARVFQAYGCSYAMLLDMNALEHTYLALYAREGEQVAVQHLIPGMNEVDTNIDGQMVPRFIGFPDNRDFFYLVRPEGDQ